MQRSSVILVIPPFFHGSIQVCITPDSRTGSITPPLLINTSSLPTSSCAEGAGWFGMGQDALDIETDSHRPAR